MPREAGEATRTLDRATALADAGRTLRAWLDKLDALRGSARTKAWEKVRDDYRGRLAAIDADLAPLRAAIRERLAARRISAASLESTIQGLDERRDEAELRHHIGETSDAAFETERQKIDAQVEASRRGLAEVSGEIQRLEQVIAGDGPDAKVETSPLELAAFASDFEVEPEPEAAGPQETVGRDTLSYSGPLLVVAHPAGQQTLKLGFGSCSIGSATGCDVVLSGTGVLPEHAVVSFQHDHHVVVGAGPVEHNGRTVAKARLAHGDRIRVNGVEMIFVEVDRMGSMTGLETADDLGTWMTPRAVIEDGRQGSGEGRTVMYVAPVLLVRRAGTERRFQLDFGSRTIGTAATCDIVLARDPEVLPRHAAVHFEHDHYVVIASDTVQVNGKAARRSRITDGDVIRIGRTEIFFTAGPAK